MSFLLDPPEMKTGNKLSVKRFLLYPFELQAPIGGPDGTRTRNLVVLSDVVPPAFASLHFRWISFPSSLIPRARRIPRPGPIYRSVRQGALHFDLGDLVSPEGRT